jgi:hypothetical protein
VDVSDFGVVVVAVVILGFAWIAWYTEKKRREALAQWAASHGWILRTGTIRGIDKEYPGLKFLAKGRSRKAKNIVSGTYEGREIRLFDYRYTTGSGKHQQTHKLGVVIIATGHPVIPLTIRRENPFDKVGEFLGADDIDFESAEFSRRFYVKSADRKWAYDVIHQRTMDYLLEGDFFDVAFGYRELAVHTRGTFAPEGYEAALRFASGLLALIPDYVVQQMKGADR